MILDTELLVPWSINIRVMRFAFKSDSCTFASWAGSPIKISNLSPVMARAIDRASSERREASRTHTVEQEKLIKLIVL